MYAVCGTLDVVYASSNAPNRWKWWTTESQQNNPPLQTNHLFKCGVRQDCLTQSVLMLLSETYWFKSQAIIPKLTVQCVGQSLCVSLSYALTGSLAPSLHTHIYTYIHIDICVHMHWAYSAWLHHNNDLNTDVVTLSKPISIRRHNRNVFVPHHLCAHGWNVDIRDIIQGLSLFPQRTADTNQLTGKV